METIKNVLRLAGLAQVVLALGSLGIPKVLNWGSELVKVQPLIKQMIWTHAAYILVINLCLGSVSIFAFRDMTNGSPLAIMVSGFIAAYWISRVLIQFFYFDRSNFPAGKWSRLAEVVLVALFICLSATYSTVFYVNLK